MSALDICYFALNKTVDDLEHPVVRNRCYHIIDSVQPIQNVLNHRMPGIAGQFATEECDHQHPILFYTQFQLCHTGFVEIQHIQARVRKVGNEHRRLFQIFSTIEALTKIVVFS